MCDICRQMPCHPRCPNAPEHPIAYECSNCDRDIYEGEDVYHIAGEHWCAACINACKSTAEVEDEF